MTNLKLIIKVGKKSKLKFSHSKVYRAIDIDSLTKLSNYVTDCHIVVIEYISKEEENATREFIKEFTGRDSKNIVMFYIPEEDDVTSGLADEFNYDIHMSLESLYKEIYNKCGYNVSTFLKDKKELNKESNYEIDNVSLIFGDINNEFDTEINNTLEQSESVEELIHKENETEEIEKNNEDLTESSEESFENTNITDEEALVEIARLKMKLNDAKEDYRKISLDMVDAIKRTEQLEKIVRVLTDEKEVIQQTFNEIVESDTVLEEPVSLSEYEGIKEDLDIAHLKIKELEKHIESLNETIEINKETILSNENKIKDTNDKLEKLNNSIDSGEIHRELIDKHKGQLEEMQVEKDTLQSELINMQGKYANLLNSIKSTEDSIGIYSKYVIETKSVLKTIIDNNIEKENKISELSVDMAELDNKLTSINGQLNDANKVIDEYSNEIKQLKEDIDRITREKDTALKEKDTIEKRNELSNNYSEQEINKLNDKVASLEEQLRDTTEQLNSKESLYNSMVEKTTLESSNTQSLIETNKSLESINKSLREKLNIVIKEADKFKLESDTLKGQLEASKVQCKNLNEAVQALSGAGIGDGRAVINSTVRNINYSGKASIIPVFGSGSFGITTTAISLAYKLCPTSKVLFIDLDLITPKADSWFNKMPMIRGIPGVSGTGLNDTGMGIFFNKGMSVVSGFLDNIIIKGCEVTKGGCIDYISGCYGKMEQTKIADADFTTLLSMLGAIYDYIIIDLGRIGASEVTDSLIKELSDISYRTIVVTTSDRFDTRNFKNKLLENKIKMDKIAWMLNMCESTTIEDKVKQYIGPINYGIMLNDSAMRGGREQFMKNKVNRDKLDLFLDTAVFCRK